MNQNLISSIRAAVVLVAGLLGLLQFNSAHAFEYDLSGRNYDAQEARRYQRVRVGVIEDIRITETTRESRNGGNAIAAVMGLLGGVGGQFVGNGRSKMAASAILGTGSAIVGKVVGDYVSRERKVTAEIIVTMNNGETLAIVQEVDQDTAQLQPNDRVRLIEGQSVRVVKFRAPTGPMASTY